MRKPLRKLTLKLITALIDEWVRTGDDRYKDAAEDIQKILQGLK